MIAPGGAFDLLSNRPEPVVKVMLKP